MRKSYSLVKLFDGVTNMSDLTRKIADLTYWTRQLLVMLMLQWCLRVNVLN